VGLDDSISSDTAGGAGAGATAVRADHLQDFAVAEMTPQYEMDETHMSKDPRVLYGAFIRLWVRSVGVLTLPALPGAQASPLVMLAGTMAAARTGAT
jgi:hypothetical protein